MAVPRFSFKAGRALIQDGTRTVLDTAAKSFNAVPGAVITINPFTLSYPDFNNKSYRYLWGRGTIPGDAFNRAYEICRSLAKVNQEETTLPNIDLGALPLGTDFLETRVNLTRTITPAASWGSISPSEPGLYAWPSEIIQGQWMQLIGNSMLAERGDNWARLFEIVIVSQLDGAGKVIAKRAVLRRRQTVGALGFETGQIEAKANVASSASSPQLREGDGNHCSFVNSYNYASTYTGVLEITPCSYRSGP